MFAALASIPVTVAPIRAEIKKELKRQAEIEREELKRQAEMEREELKRQVEIEREELRR
jgi:hypothetical protein